MARWIEPQPIEIPPGLLGVTQGDRLLAAALFRRGIRTAEAAAGFLNPNDYRPRPPSDLPDLLPAVERLRTAVTRGEMIGLWGDFDADGLTSAALLLETLRCLGARVEYYIPDRLTESHGIHLRPLQTLISRGMRVLLTCDTGSTENEAIAYARGQSVDVIVTDHHDLSPERPRAYALVNPKLLPPDHPLRELSGAGCAFKLAEELYSQAGQAERSQQALDLAAIGLVADVAILQGDVRYLVQRGIEALRRNERLGLQALLERAEIRAEGVNEEQIGFGLAPRLNALGRLAEATAAVELFTTQDVVRARTIATEMEALNVERQLLCNQVMGAAISLVERHTDTLRPPVLVLDHADWPAGIIGIVAGRLAERYNRPAVVISTGADGVGRGSARSLPGVDIRAAIAAQGPLLQRFGGHPMAAGFSLVAENIPAFRRGLADSVRASVGKEPPERSIEISAFVPPSAITIELAARIERLAPFGNGNPPMYLAAQRLRIAGDTTLGRTAEHRKLIVQEETGARQPVIWWHSGGSSLPDGLFDLAYTIRTRDYRGQREVQIEWLDARLVEREMVTIKAAAVLDVIDCRSAQDPETALRRLLAEDRPNAQLWGEAAGESFARRDQLQPDEVLVVWTIPPGPDELSDAIRRVSPTRVYLFGNVAGLDDAQRFLPHLAGLLKHDLKNREGRSRIEALAAALGHRQSTVREGILRLAARGLIRIVADETDGIQLAAGDGRPDPQAGESDRLLIALLNETAAFRRHFLRVDASALIPSARLAEGQ